MSFFTSVRADQVPSCAGLLKKSLAVLGLAAGLSMGLTVAVQPAHAAWDRYDRDRYDDIRGLIGRTQDDLRAASDFAGGRDKERDRYRNAQKHLSTFDRHLSKGHFDKDTLDKTIDDIKNVLDHNTLHTEAREALRRDIEDLRVVRERR